MDTPVVEQSVAMATVEKMEKSRGPGIHRLTLYAPEVAAAARPGQFVMVRVSPSLDPLLRRPFSIHRVLGRTSIQLLFREVGKGTMALAGLCVGDRISILGPLGRGFRRVPGPFCLVGGGMGMAPLLFLAESLVKESPAAEREKCGMLFGARNREELVGADLFEALGAPVSFATDDGSFGHHGLVTDLLAKRGERPGGLAVYACGPHPMLRAVATLCRERGWHCQVSLETMMACGIRACLGCAVSSNLPDRVYVHVCKDGPVFDIEEIAW